MASLLSDAGAAPAGAPPAKPAPTETWTIATAAPTTFAFAPVAAKPRAAAAAHPAQPQADARLWACLCAKAEDQAPPDDSLVEPLLGRLQAIRWQDELRAGPGRPRKLRI